MFEFLSCKFIYKLIFCWAESAMSSSQSVGLDLYSTWNFFRVRYFFCRILLEWVWYPLRQENIDLGISSMQRTTGGIYHLVLLLFILQSHFAYCIWSKKHRTCWSCYLLGTLWTKNICFRRSYEVEKASIWMKLKISLFHFYLSSSYISLLCSWEEFDL